jgi:hypothetical protein
MDVVGIGRRGSREAAAQLQYRRYSVAGTVHVGERQRTGGYGCEGRWERWPWGFAHGRQERRFFFLISCLIRLIHLLSLYREEVLLNP